MEAYSSTRYCAPTTRWRVCSRSASARARCGPRTENASNRQGASAPRCTKTAQTLDAATALVTITSAGRATCRVRPSWLTEQVAALEPPDGRHDRDGDGPRDDGEWVHDRSVTAAG